MNDWQKMTAEAICRVCNAHIKKNNMGLIECVCVGVDNSYCKELMEEIQRTPRDNYEKIIMMSREQMAEDIVKSDIAADVFCQKKYCPHWMPDECKYYTASGEIMCQQAALNWLKEKPREEK